MSEHATTGDGILAALFVAARMATTGASLAELAGVMERLPQVLVNVPHVDRRRVHSDDELQAAVAAGRGRARPQRAACCCVRRAPSRSSG